MDVLDIRNSDSRNGLDSGYFNFSATKAKRYANTQTQVLADSYPITNDRNSLGMAIQKIKAQRTALENERAGVKSKASKKSLDARLSAYNEYIADMESAYQELSQNQVTQVSDVQVIKEAPSGNPNVATAILTQSSPTETAPKDSVLGSSSVGNEGSTTQQPTPSVSGLQSMVSGVTASAKGSKTWMYIAGVAVLVGGFLLLRRKK